MDKQIYITHIPKGEFNCSINGIDLSVIYNIYPIDFEKDFQKPLHKHIFYEIIYVFEGKYTFENEFGQCVIEKGNTIIVSPACEHRTFGVEKCVACSIGLTIKKQKNYDNIFKAFEKEMSVKKYVIIDQDEECELKNTFSEFARRVGSPYRLTSCLINLFFLICEAVVPKQYFDSEMVLYDKNNIEAIRNALLYTYTTNINARDIAEKIFLSERQVNRICHRIFGRSFNQQKNYFRIENAKNLLINTDMTVLKISIECGFSSESNFYSMFLKMVGMTPKKYRDEHNKK